MAAAFEGPKHLDDAASYCHLGNLHGELGDLERAKDFHYRALEIRLKKLGPEHVDVAAIYKNLGIICEKLGEIDRAKEWYERALDILLKKLGPGHVAVAASYNNLGILHWELGDLERAKDFHYRALEIRLKKLGPEHVDVAATYNNLGIICEKLGEIDPAKEWYERALDILLKKLGPGHVDVAASYRNLGIIYEKLGEIDRARDFHYRALEIRLKKLGPEHLDLAATSNNLYERALAFRLKKLGPEHVDVAATYDSLDLVTGGIPWYVLHGGPSVLNAYQRGLKFGKTYDKRTKILLIGQDRVGKTSLRKHLQGVKFDRDETSTSGVEMMPAVKNAAKQAWKNPASFESTSAFDHKCAELINKELSRSSPEKSHSARQLRGEDDSPKKESGTEKPRGDGLTPIVDTETVEGDIRKQNQEQIPVKVASLLRRKNPDKDDGIWPIIWDFAGQAVYHAIHPIFLSQEAIYVLALDLTRELTTPAQCRVQPRDHAEVEVTSPDTEDTNLDHILKWLDLVHCLSTAKKLGRTTEGAFPPVILVGTHADIIRNSGRDPTKVMDAVLDKISDMAPHEIVDHIHAKFVIDNTKAGCPVQQEDQEIVSMRQRILELAEKMPHTKNEIPLLWHYVEEKIFEMVEKKEHYLPKKRFQKEVADALCHFDVQDDVEGLLHFLRSRGTVIYHDHPENPDGLVVLDPQWLIDVLSKIITVYPTWEARPSIKKHYRVLGNTGFLSNVLLNQSFKNLKLERTRKNLLELMEKFNLICNSRGCKGRDFPYFVPCMLTLPMNDKRSKYMENGPLPVYLTFNTNYVPAGLFCRLISLFWEWTSQLCGIFIEPTLFANSARFNVSKFYHITLEAHKTVISLKLWTNGDSNQEEEKKICGQLLRDFAASCKYSVHDAPSFCPKKLDPWIQALSEFKKGNATAVRIFYDVRDQGHFEVQVLEKLSSFVVLTSDYRHDGISHSDDRLVSRNKQLYNIWCENVNESLFGLDRDSLPLDLDFSKDANIVRLKFFNDDVYSHANQASVDDATFNFYWQDISAAKVVLGGFGYRSAIGKLKNKCMDPLMESAWQRLRSTF
ncbi:Nephrocystin-3 [Stylophora pistillata]|uniref:Nephrocystin-3 n=1 Tax=Stylophora pistillata TaxID=50429 RepID=A0A2B4RMB0_STYPI|nr:Nephrocystin-3 [Stylophora pistillata]